MMPSSEDIPDIVIGRLPIYLRALTQFKLADKKVTSSRELGQYLGMSSAQIRKDLAKVGRFGKQGTGYDVGMLHSKLQQILRVDRRWATAVVGAGDLGHALAHYRGFHPRGFEVVAVFDNAPDKIGEDLTGSGLVVQPMDSLPRTVREKRIRIAMLAVPADVAQEVADFLVKSGIRAILNYAPINLSVPDGVYVQYSDPVIELQHMTYYLSDE